MRTTVTYRNSLIQIWKGVRDLNLCFVHTVMNNKAITMLVISLLLNISLIMALAQERINRDQTSLRMYHLEHENDSLRGANIKYYSYTYGD